MVKVTKTLKLGVHKDIHAIKRQAIRDTQILYNRVIAFYMDFFVAHWGVFEEKVLILKKNGESAERHWTNQELLTLAETHTLSTMAHSEPLTPLVDAVPEAPGMPTGLRRAAINHASGKVKGWHIVHQQWEHGGKKRANRNWAHRMSRSRSMRTWSSIPPSTCCPKRLCNIHLCPSSSGMRNGGKKSPYPSYYRSTLTQTC